MRNSFRALFVVMMASLFIIRPSLSYADWNGHNGDGHGHDNGHEHGHDHGHSFIGVDLSLWPDNYYYGALYYPPADEVLVSPSIYEPVVMDGTTYYLNNGTYYAYNGYSYQALAPQETAPQPVTVQEPPAVADQTDEITINIPNDKGGYTAVTLKKSGDGFIGPQGEFYPEFPKVSQLKVIYGK